MATAVRNVAGRPHSSATRPPRTAPIGIIPKARVRPAPPTRPSSERGTIRWRNDCETTLPIAFSAPITAKHISSAGSPVSTIGRSSRSEFTVSVSTMVRISPRESWTRCARKEPPTAPTAKPSITKGNWAGVRPRWEVGPTAQRTNTAMYPVEAAFSTAALIVSGRSTGCRHRKTRPSRTSAPAAVMREVAVGAGEAAPSGTFSWACR